MIYVQGYSLISALGRDARSSVRALRQGNPTPSTLAEGIPYFKITDTPLDYYDGITHVVQEALRQSSLTCEERKEAALFLGTSSAKLPLNEYYMIHDNEIVFDLYIDEITEIIAQRVGIEGFRTVISTACTSSANALIQAKAMLEFGLITHAVVVGIELYNQFSLKGFESFMLLSRNTIAPFDANRDGIVLGEAISAVVLSKKRTPFKLAGGAVTVDTASITAPSPENLALVMQKALENAQIGVHDIAVVKTHSTATLQNDAAEAQALRTLFGKNLPKIVALKPYIGHTMGACGTNELVVLMEAMQQGFIPKTINFKTMDSVCGIHPSLEELKVQEGYYLLNYFGFGGNNSSIVLAYEG